MATLLYDKKGNRLPQVGDGLTKYEREQQELKARALRSVPQGEWQLREFLEKKEASPELTPVEKLELENLLLKKQIEEEPHPFAMILIAMGVVLVLGFLGALITHGNSPFFYHG